MNVYTCTNFRGHYPVGTSAVVVADDRREARKLLIEELRRKGLEPSADEARGLTFDQIFPVRKGATILQDGDY
jgi:hypothetical protein